MSIPKSSLEEAREAGRKLAEETLESFEKIREEESKSFEFFLKKHTSESTIDLIGRYYHTSVVFIWCHQSSPVLPLTPTQTVEEIRAKIIAVFNSKESSKERIFEEFMNELHERARYDAEMHRRYGPCLLVTPFESEINAVKQLLLNRLNSKNKTRT